MKTLSLYRINYQKNEKSVNSKSEGLSQGVFHAFQKAIYVEENKSPYN